MISLCKVCFIITTCKSNAKCRNIGCYLLCVQETWQLHVRSIAGEKWGIIKYPDRTFLPLLYEQSL